MVVPGGCLNRVLQTMAENNRNLLSHSCGGWKSEIKVFQGQAPAEGSRGGSCFTSSGFGWRPATLGVPWLVDASLQFLSLSPCALLPCTCLFSSCKDTSHTGLRLILLQYDLILTNYICNNPTSKKVESKKNDTNELIYRTETDPQT